MAMADKYAAKARRAQKERRRFNMCERKRQFSSEAAAKRHNKGQEAYRCPYCKQWHLASPKRLRAGLG